MLLDLVALLRHLVLQVAVEPVYYISSRVPGCIMQVLSLDIVDVHLQLRLPVARVSYIQGK